jgi:predicted anti-sigma-YlaC factor YlaD
MMTCREVYGFLDGFLDGSLDALTRLAFKGHLMLCSACRKYLATYRATIEVARGSERAEAPPDDIPEELIRIILASRGTATREPQPGS